MDRALRPLGHHGKGNTMSAKYEKKTAIIGVSQLKCLGVDCVAGPTAGNSIGTMTLLDIFLLVMA